MDQRLVSLFSSLARRREQAADYFSRSSHPMLRRRCLSYRTAHISYVFTECAAWDGYDAANCVGIMQKANELAKYRPDRHHLVCIESTISVPIGCNIC